MGNTKKTDVKSRRSFLSIFMADQTETKPEMIKMLTADGKLVEVEKAIFEKASTKQKATNKEIFQWMKNPSKDNNS